MHDATLSVTRAQPSPPERFRLAVDGGGTGTRTRLLGSDGRARAEAESGPSALSQGVAQAWINIDAAIRTTFTVAAQAMPEKSQLALALGLSGAEVASWRDELLRSNPGYGSVQLTTDGTTSLLGAHGGEAGVMVACGTGVVGEVLDATGKRRTVSAWGFPYGDEGSGAWLGRHAVARCMHAIDGRAPHSPLSDAIRARCGTDRFSLLDWIFAAGQADFASLAPLVFEHAPMDPNAETLLVGAAAELDRVVTALDPDARLPVAVLGSIGQRLASRLQCSRDGRLRPARGTALDGASLLFSHSLETWS